MLPASPRSVPALLLAACVLGSSPAAADVITTRGGGPLDAHIELETSEKLLLRTDTGWLVRLPLERVLAVRDPARGLRVPLADHLEDMALRHEGRGELDAAQDAYEDALDFVLDAARAGALSAEEASAHAEVYLRRLHFFASERARSQAVLGIFARALQAPTLTPFARDVARRYRSWHLRRLGRTAEARADEEALGLVHAFFVIGPFDNERGRGFRVAYPPEREPFDPGASYPGKTAPVGWRPQPVAAPPNGVIDFDALMHPDDQGLAYALTYLHAEARTPVALRLGSDESVALWLNGVELQRSELRRLFHADQEQVGCVLAPGWNQVLVKVADQTGPWRLSLRVSAPAGGPVAGVRAASLEEIAAAPPHAAGAERVEATRGGLAWLEDACGTHPRAWRARFHLGYLHFAYQLLDEGAHADQAAWLAALRIHPESAPLWTFLAHASEVVGEHSVNQETNARRMALERALHVDPEHDEARLLLARHYARAMGNADKASAALRPAMERRPGHPAIQLLWADLLEARGLGPAAGAHRRGLLARAEERIQRGEQEHLPLPFIEQAILAARERGDVLRQLEMRERRVEQDRADPDAYAELAELQASAGRTELAELLYGEAIRRDPFRLDLRIALAGLLERARRQEAAARVLDEALRIAPDDVGLLARRGRLAIRRGRASQGEALLRQALVLDPKRVDLEEYLEMRARHGQREAPFEQAWIIDPAPLIAAAAARPLEPRRTHRVLFRQEVDRLNPDGTRSSFVQEVLRVENEQGRRELASYRAAYGSEQRLQVQLARVHRARGGSEDAPVGTVRGWRGGEFSSRRSTRVALPPLELGDVIEVRYRVDDLEQGFFGDYYGRTVFFQGAQPIDWVRFALIAPAERTLHFNLRGLPADALQRDAARIPGSVVHVVERREVPALEAEPAMPWARELLPALQVSSFPDWDAFARWYWGLIAPQHEVDAAMRAKVQELCAGARTPAEKIRRIYEFVVTDIRYNAAWEFGVHGFKPYKASSIFARRFGDCKDKATLLKTLLGEVGIAAHPVLIFGEEQRGREDLSLPLINHFNHCIAWVDHGEGGIFLDGTAEWHPYGTLPTMDYGAEVVVVTPEKALLRTIPFRSPEANLVRERHALRLRADGSADLRSRIEGSGDYEVVLRRWLETAGRRKNLLEPRIGRVYSGARVVSVRTSDVNELSEPLWVEMTVELPELLQPSGDGRFELAPWRSWLFELIALRGRKLSALAADAQRSHDLILGVPTGVEEEVVYELPPDMNLADVPAPVLLEEPFGRYELRFVQEGGQLRCTRVLRFERNRIPLAEYEAFRRFVQEVERAEQVRLLFERRGAKQ